MRIITLTLNPAFDLHCFAKELKLYSENFVKGSSSEAGGKGVNISRALSANGIDNQALVVVGKDNAEAYLEALEKDNLSVLPIFTGGRIRENVTIHEEGKDETRISFNGFIADREILQKIKDKIGTVDENTVIAFAGSVSEGTQIDDVLAMLSDYKDCGAKIIIDSRSVPFDKLIDFGPWMIKPNREEAELYAGRKINNTDDAVAVAEEWHLAGVSNVLITLGGDGAVLVCQDGIFAAKAPKIEALSTIGAGDSTIAGFIDGALKGIKGESILKKAVAYGSSACMREGTRPPKTEDIKSIEEQIIVFKKQINGKNKP